MRKRELVAENERLRRECTAWRGNVERCEAEITKLQERQRAYYQAERSLIAERDDALSELDRHRKSDPRIA